MVAGTEVKGRRKAAVNDRTGTGGTGKRGAFQEDGERGGNAE